MTWIDRTVNQVLKSLKPDDADWAPESVEILFGHMDSCIPLIKSSDTQATVNYAAFAYMALTCLRTEHDAAQKTELISRLRIELRTIDIVASCESVRKEANTMRRAARFLRQQTLELYGVSSL